MKGNSMRPQAHFRGTLVLRLSVLTALALGALYGCARLKSSPVAVTPPKAAPEEITVYPAEAPASVKLNDFRFNPPEVLEIRVKKLSSPAPGGNVVFMAHFAEDKRLG